MDDAFHFDGFCTESPSYSAMHLNQLREIPELLDGYSDPEGYEPGNGAAMKNLDPFRHFDRYRLALESMVRMLDPNLQEPVIGDSREGRSIEPVYAETLAAHYGQPLTPVWWKTHRGRRWRRKGRNTPSGIGTPI